MSDYYKLVVDGKTIYVFDSAKVPKEVLRLKHLTGVSFEDATYWERQPFIELEAKIEYMKKKNSYVLSFVRL